MPLPTLSPEDEEQALEWRLFLTASPFGVDLGTPEALDHATTSELPENLRQILFGDRTAARIYVMGQESSLRDEQISDLARIVKRIFVGEVSSADVESSVQNILSLSERSAQVLARKLSQELIAPNYFQIAQMYEKRHGLEVREAPHSTGTPDEPERAEQTFPTTSPTSTRSTAPPRVVDLRNGAIPKRLPTTPPVTPPPETQDASPDHQNTPTLPPTSPMRGGPSADDLLKTFGTRPAPSSPSGGPRHGPHGPLPPPLTER